MPKKEQVDHPSHYNQGQFEVIDVIEDWQLDFHAGNVVKYLARYKHKENPIQDLKKARWYLDRLIALLEKKN
jgi:predicted 2-oxoglutarate/Fe(II)-dependent dioxygenase YbiX